MDENFHKAKAKFEEAKGRKDTDVFWKVWSKAVEDAYVKNLKLETKAEEKAMQGRGKVIMSKKVPGKANRKEDLIKQARRAEQILYRSEAMDGKEQSKKEQYMKLNREAAKLMRKNVDRQNEWEEDLKQI